METLTEQRRRAGQQQRKKAPRTGHAHWDPKLRRRDPLQLLAASDKGRLPDLVRLKYERMAASPFGYLRGAAPVMAYDLSLVPHSGIVAQLCGDAHVRNLGAYAGPDGRLVFDINDFDETIAGPFEWDVKRMASSLVVAGRGATIRDSDCREAALVFLAQYRSTMQQLSRLPVLEMARFQVRRLRSVAAVNSILKAAERSTPLHTLDQLTERIATRRRFRNSDLVRRIVGEQARRVLASLQSYAKTLEPERRGFLAQYRPLDVAFKAVGTGSLGLRDYCVYMEGNGARDPLFLQIKQAVRSVYEPYVAQGRKGAQQPAQQHSAQQHQGERVVEGERAMQLQSDAMLGWTRLEERDYLVRQLNDHKASLDLDELDSAELLEYAEVCGELLARGHARSGACQQIAGYIGRSSRLDQAVAQFAFAYADQTVADWKQLTAWWKKQPKRRVGQRLRLR